MRYRLVRSIAGTHSQGITQVAFSPDGASLATSDLSGKVCVWRTWTGTLSHYYTPGTSILALVWANVNTIFCGLGDGTVISLHLGNEQINILGNWIHAYPVEHLAITDKHLASGAHSEVSIWKINDPNQYTIVEKELGGPVKSEGKEVLVTGLHWMTPPRRRAKGLLIVTYMFHGVFLFDCQNWTLLRRFGQDAPGVMARSSLSPDGSRLAVSNLVYGFDIYDISTGALALAVTHEVGKEYPVPVLYIHGGRAILGGSTIGVVNIWYVDKSISRKMQTLSVSGAEKILSLAAHYDTDTDQFLIAAGAMDDTNSLMILWRAEDPRSTDAGTAVFRTSNAVSIERAARGVAFIVAVLMAFAAYRYFDIAVLSFSAVIDSWLGCL
ncbi:WD40-repeat-containing domain protein [Cubamyces lactineus]|nr:WD40-repeat-containing domain protein [Cubamyces lactineus]